MVVYCMVCKKESEESDERLFIGDDFGGICFGGTQHSCVIRQSCVKEAVSHGYYYLIRSHRAIVYFQCSIGLALQRPQNIDLTTVCSI
jgi:hypothetical protein